MTRKTVPASEVRAPTSDTESSANNQQLTTDSIAHSAHFRAGYAALIGKPNVGKSTLLNRIVGHKVSIVSSKPQTTRRRVVGIAQGADYQIAFIDTPGIHEPHTRLGRAMVDQARGSLSDADLVVYVADGAHAPTDMDREIAKLLRPTKRQESKKVEEEIPSADPENSNTPILQHPNTLVETTRPILVCLNKMDLLRAEEVVPHVEAYTKLFGTDEYMMTTATRGDNVDALVKMIVDKLPHQAALYPEDEFTDQSSRFMAGELVREKILLATRQEVPHATAVMVDSWDESNPEVTVVQASIIVEKSSQRAILLGKGGQFIKAIGIKAREELETLLGHRIYLELHVRVQEGWRMSPRVLHELEYDG